MVPNEVAATESRRVPDAGGQVKVLRRLDAECDYCPATSHRRSSRSRTILTLLPRKQKRGSNKRASTEPGAVQCTDLSDGSNPFLQQE